MAIHIFGYEQIGTETEQRMRTIDIAIAVKDIDYANALASALARNVKGLSITILEDDPINEYDEQIKEESVLYDTVSQRFDAVLTDIDFSPEDDVDKRKNEGNDQRNIIRLCEHPGPGSICKYGNIREITDAILGVVNKDDRQTYTASDALRFENDVDIYLFVSDAGGTGCSSCAVRFAESLSLTMGKRTLYIDAAPLPGRLFGGEWKLSAGEDDTAAKRNDIRDNRNISDPGNSRNLRKLIYHISEGKEMSRLLSTYLTENERGVFMFRPYRGLSPLASISSQLFEAFLGCIEKSGLFDTIVIDAGNHLNESMLTAAALSKKVFVIYDNRRIDDGNSHKSIEYGHGNKSIRNGHNVKRADDAGADEKQNIIVQILADVMDPGVVEAKASETFIRNMDELCGTIA